SVGTGPCPPHCCVDDNPSRSMLYERTAYPLTLGTGIALYSGGTQMCAAGLLKRGTTMTQSEHLWAIGYDDMGRAEQVRDEIIRLGWHTHYLALLDVAVVVRHPDGSFTCNRERFPSVTNILGCTAVGFLAGLVLLAPLTGATVGALLGGAGTA